MKKIPEQRFEVSIFNAKRVESSELLDAVGQMLDALKMKSAGAQVGRLTQRGEA